MARILSDGAEDPRGIALSMTGYVATNAAIVTSPVRSGAKAYRLVTYAGTGYMYKNFTGLADGYYRCAWRVTINNNTVKTIRFRNGTTELITLGLSTANQNFQILVGGSVVATGTFVYALDVYYLLEFYIKIDDGAGVIQMKVDGKLDIDYSGDTKPGAQTTIDNWYWASVGGGDTYIDDIAINDTSGAADNSWCGDGRIIYYTGNGAGDVTGLTPNTGANYAAIDELAHDSDTTYVEGGTVDLYDLYNLAASGIAAGSTINRVIPVAVAKDTVANGGKIAIGIKTDSTEDWSDDRVLTTSYTGAQGDEYLVNPVTGVAWTIAELDALQVGVKMRGT